jgi:aspartyl-tRNA(Asn)/glutamyl-tRNA(Gln) amidotransferase subunit C
MQAVNTEGIEPLSHPLDTTARLRSDEVTEKPDPEHFQRGAPATADHYYLVPRVVE